MKPRVRFAAIVACLLIARGVSAQASEHEKHFSKLLFKGRFIAVAFDTSGLKPQRYEALYQFVVVESYLESGHAPGILVTLKTGKKTDIKEITEDSYAATLASVMPKDIKLGSLVIVEGSWPKAEKSLVDMVPYSEADEAALKKKHAESIQYIAKAVHKAKITSLRGSISAAEADIERIDAALQQIKDPQQTQQMHNMRRELEAKIGDYKKDVAKLESSEK